MEFEWDKNKDSYNQKFHGVSFDEAVESFFDPLGFKMYDEKHSTEEERFFWVAKSSTGRVLTTRFTLRGEKIRILGSAEWRKFRKLYDETTKNK